MTRTVGGEGNSQRRDRPPAARSALAVRGNGRDAGRVGMVVRYRGEGWLRRRREPAEVRPQRRGRDGSKTKRYRYQGGERQPL